MNKIAQISLLLTLLLLFGCKKTQEPTLVGTLSDNTLNGKHVLLIAYDNEGVISDTPDTAIIQNNAFSFTGDHLYEGIYYLLSDDEGIQGELADGIPLYIGPSGAKVTINDKKLTISGHPQNDAFQTLRDSLSDAFTDRENLYTEYVEYIENHDGILPPEMEKTILDRDQDMISKQKSLFANYFHTHLTEALGEEVFLYYLQQGYLDFLSPEDLDNILASARESFRFHPTLVELLYQLKERD